MSPHFMLNVYAEMAAEDETFAAGVTLLTTAGTISGVLTSRTAHLAAQADEIAAGTGAAAAVAASMRKSLLEAKGEQAATAVEPDADDDDEEWQEVIGYYLVDAFFWLPGGTAVGPRAVSVRSSEVVGFMAGAVKPS